MGTVTDRQAMLDSGLGEFDQVHNLTWIQNPTYQGSGAARAYIPGGGNAYSRGIFNVNWRDGDEVWFGAAFYLPQGFLSKVQGQVDLLRWDNWATYGDVNDKSAVVIGRTDKRGKMVRIRQSVEQIDLGSDRFEIPEGRWFWLEFHQKLSRTSGQALSEVYLDGKKVASSTTANTYGRPIDRVRFGIVAIDANRQKNSLQLYFDRAMVRRGPIGPIGSNPPADTTPPETVITSGPSGSTESRSASFAFSASESGSTFECRLDGGSWQACTSPRSYSNLSTGQHTFQVRAKDQAGNVDASPASRTWTVVEPQADPDPEPEPDPGQTGERVELAKGKATSASSSSYDVHAPSNAVDRNASTRWSSAYRDGEWWQVDLGATKRIDSVRLNWADAYASRYQVQVSNDGRSFTTVATESISSNGWHETRFTPVDARYVRIVGLSRAMTQWGISFYEAEVYGTDVPAPTRSELAKGKATSASSSSYSVHAPSNAVDRNASTRWSSAYRDGEWWQVDLGQTRKVDSVRINWADAYASSYRVQVSTDGKSWTTVATESISSNGWHETKLNPVDARYVRIVGLSRAMTQWGISFYEAEVYGW